MMVAKHLLLRSMLKGIVGSLSISLSMVYMDWAADGEGVFPFLQVMHVKSSLIDIVVLI